MAHPGPCVLVGTGHAFGEALSLDTADAVLFVMLPYTPGQLRQWEGRFMRASTKKPVIIYYVIAEGTADEHIASLLIDKLPNVEKVANDIELGEAREVLAGFEVMSDDDFAKSILSEIDLPPDEKDEPDEDEPDEGG
jgi:SNF2 family DNA or RNA helicase